MTFNELRLAEPLVRAVTDHGYVVPTPIQTQAIPAALAGRDVLGCAQTGTGKTAAFCLPILHRLAGHAQGRSPRALILCPTRELAAQIHESIRSYGVHAPLRCAVVVGGVSQSRQTRALRGGVDVLIATPGRLLDLMNQGFVDLRAIEVLVLDEADRMLDMGFIRDIRSIMKQMPRDRQTLLFSATMPAAIRSLAGEILRKAVHVQAHEAAPTIERISQSVYMVNRADKRSLLENLLRDGTASRTLVFTRTKHGADRLVKVLRRSGFEVGAIHGNKTQGARTRALDGFRSGAMPILVATDVAARGIDVDGVTHVVNFDVPSDPETYIHRIGRTARAGATGIALTFCDRDESANLRAIELLIRKKLTVASTNGSDPEDSTLRDRPARSGSRLSRRGGPSKSRRTRRAPRENSSSGRRRLTVADLQAPGANRRESESQ